MKKQPARLALVPPPDPTAGLRPEVVAWVREIEDQYDLEAHHRQLLQLAAVQLSRAATARAVLDSHGLTFVDRFRQPKLRPEVDAERNASHAARLLLRELGLSLGDEAGRLPRVGG